MIKGLNGLQVAAWFLLGALLMYHWYFHCVLPQEPKKELLNKELFVPRITKI